MAKRSNTEQSKQANLSLEQMKAALPKLRRRIAELQEVDINSIEKRGEARFDALEQKIDSTLVDTSQMGIYGFSHC